MMGKGQVTPAGCLLGAPVSGSWGLVPPTLCPQLSQETGAHIDVEREDEGEEVVLLISGSPGQVCRAKAAIHQIVTESAPVSEQLCVPQRAVGRIIGTSTPLGPFYLPWGSREQWEVSQIYPLSVCGSTITVSLRGGGWLLL